MKYLGIKTNLETKGKICTQRIKLFVEKEELKRRGMKAGRNQIASEEFKKGAAPDESSQFLPLSSHTYSVIL